MTIINTSLLLISIATGLFIGQVAMEKQATPESVASSEITCKEALQNVSKIKVGLKESEVLELLGKPTNIEKEVWAYNFWDCMPPPKVGSQSIVAVGLTFKDKVVTKIDYATICATGPGN